MRSRVLRGFEDTFTLLRMYLLALGYKISWKRYNLNAEIINMTFQLCTPNPTEVGNAVESECLNFITTGAAVELKW